MPGFRRVPDNVRALIQNSTSDTFYVGATRTVALDDLAAGAFSHLAIGVDDGVVVHEAAVLPAASRGRWSRWNVVGRWVVRPDLPKVSKSWGWESPNFGDWSKGSHHTIRTRDVYQRQLLYGQSIPLLLDVSEASEGDVTVGCRVDRILDRQNLDEVDLLFALSLLRENFGRVGILAADLTIEEWLADQQVDWELLPIGVGEGVPFARVLGRLPRQPSPQRLGVIQSRYDAVRGMSPGAIVVGQGQFTRYFGFKFRDDLVALENLDYGNALYLMYEDWQTLSQRSRVDLLKNPNENYDRVVHTSGWESRLRDLLAVKGHNPSP